ncbi:hypothetical protein TNIN_9481 [Trichonephila inaurata madagascariensis]|uniref:Uncharacterized protein n=1 Tax=Trichonephila inaurata madagascariensis TaxID=2747483 RepID=A0A8X7C8J7_9ARAC|nr:hypothetical protein TNIN_9481 [Trichonephila inaurata madagascariensis]
MPSPLNCIHRESTCVAKTRKAQPIVGGKTLKNDSWRWSVFQGVGKRWDDRPRRPFPVPTLPKTLMWLIFAAAGTLCLPLSPGFSPELHQLMLFVPVSSGPGSPVCVIPLTKKARVL